MCLRPWLVVCFQLSEHLSEILCSWLQPWIISQQFAEERLACQGQFNSVHVPAVQCQNGVCVCAKTYNLKQLRSQPNSRWNRYKSVFSDFLAKSNSRHFPAYALFRICFLLLAKLLELLWPLLIIALEAKEAPLSESQAGLCCRIIVALKCHLSVWQSDSSLNGLFQKKCLWISNI